MKQFSFLFAIIILSSTAQAQLNKGQWLVGGLASFRHSTVDGNFDYISVSNKTSSFQVSPGAGYFIVNKLCIGLRPGFSTAKKDIRINEVINGQADFDFSQSNNTAFSIAPFVRYYFLPKTNKVNLLADASYSYGHNKANWHSTGNELINVDGVPPEFIEPIFGSYNVNEFIISGGPAIFLNSKVALELLVAYTFANSKDVYAPESNLSINAGFQIYLGK